MSLAPVPQKAQAPQASGPIQASIQLKLQGQFNPVHLQVVNESHLHHGSPSSESHFKIVMAAPGWEGLKTLARHRLVMDCLQHEFSRIHAYSLHLFSETEWLKADPSLAVSPRCAGR